jgi:hypothetical protein
MATDWQKISELPADHGPVYVTDGVRVSFVMREEAPFTEVPRLILAEPDAQALKLRPQVSAPTHFAMILSLPKVSEKEAQEAGVQNTAGGPPPQEGVDMEGVRFPQAEQNEQDPLDHDGNGRKGGAKKAQS